MDSKAHSRFHLGALLPSTDSAIVAARAAERGRFGVCLLGGAPAAAALDTFALLAALAASTDRIGLVGTVDTGVGEPFSVARQVATLDHLSDGRAGWCLGGEEGAEPPVDRCERAEEFVDVVRAFWDSWAPDAILDDRVTGRYVDPGRIRAVEHTGRHFDVRGPASLPCLSAPGPVLFADASTVGAPGSRVADVVLTRSQAPPPGAHSLTLFAVAPLTRFEGPARDVAAEIERYVAAGGFDGLLLETDAGPHCLDRFVDDVVPLLAERGSVQRTYTGATLRDQLGLGAR